MLRPLRESPAARQGTHSFRVDVALACLLALLTVVLPGLDGAYAWSPEFAFGLGLVLCGALAWRRRRPVGAAAVVLAVCLVELVTLPGDLLLANVAVPMTVYALAAYGPPWAGRAGLGAGLVGSVLAAAGYQRAGQIEVAAEGIEVLPGTVEALAALPPERVAIVTSCTRELLAARLAGSRLQHPREIVTFDDVRHGKPAPDPFLLGAERLGVDPARCLAVEDAPAGLLSARTAGCTTLAVGDTHPRAELDADAHAPDLSHVRFVVTADGIGVVPA